MPRRRRLLATCLCGLLSHAAGARAQAVAVESFVEAKLLATEGRYLEAMRAFERALAAEPEEAYVRLEYARLLLQTGNLPGASQQAEAAARAAPGNVDALRLLAEVRVAQASGDPAQIEPARAALAALLASLPGDVDVSLALARLAMAAGDPAAASDVLAAARRARPRNPSLAAAYVASLRELPGVDLEAKLRAGLDAEPEVLELRFALVEELTRRLEVRAAQAVLSAAPAQQQGEAEYLRRQALLRYRDADVAGALAVLGPLEEQDDEEPATAMLRAMLLSGAGEFAAAEGALRRLEVHSGRRLSSEAVLSLARAMAMQDRLPEAARAIAAERRALAQSGDEEGARNLAFRFAAFAAEHGHWRFAEEVLSESVAQNAPADEELDLLAEIWIARGDARGAAARLAERTEVPGLAARRAEALWRSGKRREATRALASLAALGSEESIEAGQAWQRLERYSEALRVADAVLAREPRNLACRFLRASSLERLGSLPEAKREFRALLAENPTFAPALNYLAYAIADTLPAAAAGAVSAEMEEALLLARRAVAADPANPAYLDTLAWALFRSRQAAAALPLLARAALLLPGDATVWEHLGDVRRAGGDVRGARSAYVESLRRARGQSQFAVAGVKRKLRESSREIP